MSQVGKRDAATAFEGAPGSSPQQVRKRHRKSDRESQDQNAPASVVVKEVLPTVSARKNPSDPQTRKRHKKNGARKAPAVVKEESPIAVPKSSAAEQNPPPAQPTKALISVEREKGPSERLSKDQLALKAVKQERKRTNDPYLLKKSQEPTPSRPKQAQTNGHKKSAGTDNPVRKKSSTPFKKLPQSQRPREQVAESSKSLKDRTVLLKEKHQKDDPSEMVEELLGQVSGKRPAPSDEAKQLVSKRVRGPKKKSKSAKPVVLIARQSGVIEDGWAVTTTNGGMFIDQDPLLTKDDQFLILPTYSGIQIYSTKTSLLVRSLWVGSKSTITSCALSTLDSNRLYVSSSQGSITLWDWTTGARITQITAVKGVRQLLPVPAEEGHEVLLMLLDDSHGARDLVAYHVKGSTGAPMATESILQKSRLSPSVRSYAEGTILVACAEDKLLIGQSQMTADGRLDLSYTWREVLVPARIASFDVQVNSGKSKTSRTTPYLDLAVGLADGVIMHYEDLLFKLISKEKKSKPSTEDITARKLHWHRTAVNTVKWSRDRNYIISGGDETVLVIWQLDSNQKQVLPHLSTPILNLSVSPAGSSYAVRLADNSVMVLSTADLLPSTNITGLALGHTLQRSSNILFHPRTPGRLLAAVSSDAFHDNPATSLQIYDIDTSLQVTRQALTRNMITASNVAPTGQAVKEPIVTNMDLSHDGKWLATIDEWTSHDQDLEPIYISSDPQTLKGRATETSLRLWLWNEKSSTFEQATRIDEPHEPGPNSVLGMSFNPARRELATIGADATVHIWSPKARHKSGVPVRNFANEQLYTWTSSRTAYCEHGPDQRADHAALAYAEDGSVIAASWSFPSAGSSSSSPTKLRFMHLIDPTSGNIIFSQPSLLSSGPAKLLFHTRYLLCLSSSLRIFDTIICQTLTSPIQFDPLFVSPNTNAPLFLVRNRFDGTFAVGLGKSEWPRQSKVFVFGFENEKPNEGTDGSGVDVKVEYQGSFTGMLKGLLALTTGPGYFLIDERNQTRVLRHTGVGATALALTRGIRKGEMETEEVTRSLDSIFGRGSRAALVPSGNGAGAIEGPTMRGLIAPVPEEERAVQGGLESVLRFTTSAMAPSPAELFRRVVGVLGQAIEAK